MRYSILTLLFFAFFSCNENTTEKNDIVPTEILFTELKANDTQVSFKNTVVESYEFNFINYPYIYIGGGVAVGDINNDGYDDIYFTSNQQNNALYINKGDFNFENITYKAGVEDSEGWSTGVSMIDINNDGWLDIYVCKSASLNSNELRRNKLYINQKDNTFKEQAKEYGLDHQGFSTQSYFFDYDKDGDLDMYLVNHRFDFFNNSKISTEIQNQIQEVTTDHLFRNDGNTFTQVTAEAGIYNKAWGLSASIGDFNNDDWLDVYVANDYLEPDILYVNQKDGTFKNEVLESVNHITFNSMGSDFSDLNNDLNPDLLVLDMLAYDHKRGKENMASMSTENFNTMVNVGYHRQYMSNVLQLNEGNGKYKDIGQLAGITKTDWSWATLLADFNCDGSKDIFITNGIEKDITNQDFKTVMRNINAKGKSVRLDSLLSIAPSDKLPNMMYENKGNYVFKNESEKWGFTKKVNSNGVAYSDLDNDGDLDLVINNFNDVASIYKNNQSKNNYLRVKLNGNQSNKFAIGSKVIVHQDSISQSQELFLSRGFLSSVSPVLNFGLGKTKKVSKVEVFWSDGKYSFLTDLEVNQELIINHSDASGYEENRLGNSEILKESVLSGLNFKHQENEFNDFSKQLLLPQKQSTLGPCIAVGDLNGDNLQDVFFGGGRGQESVIYVQTTSGEFKKLNQNSFINDKSFEDSGVLFFDADNDNDLDIYVASSGYELELNDEHLQDRLYINDGNANFTKNSKGLPTMLSSTKAVKTIDFDNDGDNDLFVGGRVLSGKYPLAPESFILQNDNGKFTDVTNTIAPDFKTIGMVADIENIDVNKDDTSDLVLTGPWMPITVFINENGKFIKQSISEFEKSEGWNYSIDSGDFDNDGDIDFVIGNIGLNNKFQPTIEKPLHIFSGYFDDNQSYDMALSKVYKGQLVPVRGKECSSQQTPYLNEKIESYSEFASLNINDVYGGSVIDDATHKTAYNFASLYIENKGNNSFKIFQLPIEAQFGPTKDFLIKDINNDGNLDIIGVGNIYNAEVETVRYDAGRGYVLLGNGKGDFSYFGDSGLSIDKNMKAIETISVKGKEYIIVGNNDDEISVFSLK